MNHGSNELKRKTDKPYQYICQHLAFGTQGERDDVKESLDRFFEPVLGNALFERVDSLKWIRLPIPNTQYNAYSTERVKCVLRCSGQCNCSEHSN